MLVELRLVEQRYRAGGMGLFTVAHDERLECDVAHGPCHTIFRCNPEVRGGSGGCD